MKNWKTTLFGTLQAVGLILVAASPAESELKTIGAILAAAGAAGQGASAKDKDVTGIGAGARRQGE